MSNEQLIAFVRESNRIEGIHRAPKPVGLIQSPEGGCSWIYPSYFARFIENWV